MNVSEKKKSQKVLSYAQKGFKGSYMLKSGVRIQMGPRRGDKLCGDKIKKIDFSNYVIYSRWSSTPSDITSNKDNQTINSTDLSSLVEVCYGPQGSRSLFSCIKAKLC